MDRNGLPTAPAEAQLQAARAAWEAHDPQKALRSLVAGFEVDLTYQPLYRLAVECLHALGAVEEARLFEQALAHFDDARPFYDLGYHFVDVAHERLAVPFLRRALQLAPGSPAIAMELAVALTAQFQPCEAHTILAGVDLKRDFWATYQLHWCALLCNRPAGIQAFLDDARAAFRTAGAGDAQEHATYQAMLDRLQEGLQRWQTVPRPQPLVQHWHYIQYGAAILDYFDDRTDADAQAVAGGRYVALFGTLPSISGVLQKLAAWLTAVQRRPDRVIALADRDSEILGRAAAHVLNVPFAPATDQDLAAPDTLVVAADNRQYNDKPALRLVQPDQTVFALNHHWLSAAAITPDVVGHMSQAYYLPWNVTLKVDASTRKVQQTARDERPATEIVATVALAAPRDDPGFAATLAFYQARAAYLKGGLRGGVVRWQFRKDSPVPGQFFA